MARSGRSWIWGGAAATAVVGGLWLWGELSPVGVSVGPVAVSSVNGFIAVGVGTVPVVYNDPVAGVGPWPMWQLDLGASKPGMLLAPMSNWRPSRSTGMVSMGAAPAVLAATVHIYWTPVWWLLVPCAGCIGWGLRVRHLARRSGVCVGCGYSRTGLGKDAVCPECGCLDGVAPVSPGPVAS